MAKKRKGSKGQDAAAEVVRPLVLAQPPDVVADGPAGLAIPPTSTDGLTPRLPGPLGRRTGAHLCYGEPVRVGERAVIPVADVRMLGRWGRGGHTSEDDRGEGGGLLGAHPIGYIEVSADGSRYVALGVARGRWSALATGLAALGGALAVLALRRRSG